MEQLKFSAGLAAVGVVPVTETLVLDVLTDISPVYPHDKAAGLALVGNNRLALVGNNRLAISNDDDFGVLNNGQNGYAPKLLPATGEVNFLNSLEAV